MRGTTARLPRGRIALLAAAAVTCAAIGTAAVSISSASAAENVALNKPATGSAPCAANEGPEKAVNGSASGGNSDKWCSLAAGTRTLRVDLGSSASIGQFVVKHAGAGGESTSMNTRAFTIAVSTDGSTFTTVVTTSANTADVSTHDITATDARFIQLNVTSPEQGGSGAARIYEFEAYTSGPAGNLALNKPATGSTPCAADEGPEKAVNGSVSGGNTDKWCSLVAGTRTLQVDLESAQTVGGVIIRHAGAGGESTSMNTLAFSLQTSTDGANFGTVATVSNNSASISRHIWPAAPARYVRLTVTAPEQSGSGAVRIYELEVYRDPPPIDDGPSPTPTQDPPGECHADAPATISDDYVAEHTSAMTRMVCNADVAVYFDNELRALPAAQTAWIAPFITDMWRHYRETYGSCAVPRTLPAPIGPNCTRFGHPKPLMAFFHQNKYFGGTVANRFDDFSGFRNTIDVGDNGWQESNETLRDAITHEGCHIVEGASQGVHESPAFTVWGDSKWAEICQWDFYQRTSRTADAQRTFNKFTANRDGLPPGASNAAWFKDWFYPLWQQTGNNMAFMDRYFGLLSQYFPKATENDGRNLTYSRRMNAGEFVHFMSGAAGRDLSTQAAQAFNSGFNRAQFDQARRDFPAITY